MKISFFNIAWDIDHDPQVAELLNRYKIRGIEIAAGKIWEDPGKVTLKQATDYRKFWLKNGIQIVALCSILYPHMELNIFKDDKTRNDTLKYLNKIAKLAAVLGARILVFGSPKNRSYDQISPLEVDRIAVSFFKDLANIAQKHGLIIGLEPIPPEYGTKFINNSSQALKLIKQVGHPNFQLHLDSGAMSMVEENYQQVIKNGIKYLKHFHISEDFLSEIGTGKVDHTKIAESLRKNNYNGWASVEMPQKENEFDIKLLERVLKLVTKIYS